MKMRYLVIVGLVLAVLTIGAVSAEENSTGDALAIDEKYAEDNVAELVESVDEEVLASDSNGLSEDKVAVVDGKEDIPLSSGEDGPVHIYDKVAYNDDTLVKLQGPVESTVNVMVDGELRFMCSYDGVEQLEILWKDLSNYKKLKYGNYNVKVIYTEKGKETSSVYEKKVKYTFPFSIYANVVQKSQVFPSVKFTNEITFTVNVPKDAKNEIKLKFNGKTYSLNPKDGEATLKLTLDDLKLGKNSVSAKFSYSDLPTETITDSVYIYPEIIYSSKISAGENEFIYVVAPKNTNGHVELFDGSFKDDGDGTYYYEREESLKKVKLSNGFAKIPLKTLSKGSHSLSLSYQIGKSAATMTCSDDSGIFINVVSNDKGFKASVKPLKIKWGKEIKVKLVGPKIGKKAKIYIDNKLYKSVSLENGKIKEKIKNLSPGNHKVKVLFNKGGKFFSKTFYVKVKKIPKVYLKINAVTVKKSAKKLTLKAKLKIKGKAKKGLLVKFKFNKMSYKAKTNKKGIAKVVISKEIIKKLKVGQKLKYKAKYNKKIKESTVLVKE